MNISDIKNLTNLMNKKLYIISTIYNFLFYLLILNNWDSNK